MRKLFTTIAIITLFLSLFQYTFAWGLPQPFGGKIVSSTLPGISCPGTGPVTIVPVSPLFPVTNYYIAPGVPSGYGKATDGSWVIGLYFNRFPLCWTDSTPPTPYSVHPVIMYGTSNGF